MKTIWQGTDSLFLVIFPPHLTWREKYYALKLRVFARIVDKFSIQHYACGELVKRNLEKFGMEKPITLFKDSIKYDKIIRIPHEGFNVLYYIRGKSKFQRWLYGYDIFLKIKDIFRNINFIEIDGTHDLSEIYLTIDLLFRPNRHDGEPRMIDECKEAGIPVVSSLENPHLIEFCTEISYFYSLTHKQQMETKPLLTGPDVKQFRLINTSLEGLGILKDTEVRFNDKEFEYIRGFFNYFNLRNCLVSTTDIIRESIEAFPENWEEIKI